MSGIEPISMTTRLQRQSDLLIQPLDDDLVMADIDAGNYYGLGATAKRIWELLEAPVTVAALCEALLERYEVDRATCEGDVLEFLGELRKEGLVRVLS